MLSGNCDEHAVRCPSSPTPKSIDTARVEELIGDLDDGVAELSDRAVDVLSRPGAFGSLESEIASAEAAVTDATTSAQLDEIGQRVEAIGNDLDAVVDTVSALEGGDPTVRTAIVRSVSDVTGSANRVKAQLDSKRRNLGAVEAEAAFDAELALVEQTLNGSVAGATTPDECDAVLARLLVTIERLESRYGDDPDASASIAEVRVTAHEVVGERRTALLDERNRRATRIVDAATRLLDTVTRRASEFSDDKEIAAFFATDQLTSRVRELADELESLDDAGRAAEVRGGLRNAAEEARRRIRDKAALVSDDGAVVLGGVRLAQNNQPFEMVLSSRADERGNDTVAATITGTDFAVDVSEELDGFTDLLGRSFPSETRTVSRSEYLAWAVLESMTARPGGLIELLTATANPAKMNDLCQAEAERRHGDGYQRGVHDHDAARILAAVMPSLEAEPLLRFTGTVRGLARLWLSRLADDARRRMGCEVEGGRDRRPAPRRYRAGAAPRRRGCPRDRTVRRGVVRTGVPPCGVRADPDRSAPPTTSSTNSLSARRSSRRRPPRRWSPNCRTISARTVSPNSRSPSSPSPMPSSVSCSLRTGWPRSWLPTSPEPTGASTSPRQQPCSPPPTSPSAPPTRAARSP